MPCARRQTAQGGFHQFGANDTVDRRYPQDLAGDSVLLETTIVSVADVVEALLSAPRWRTPTVACLRNKATNFPNRRAACPCCPIDSPDVDVSYLPRIGGVHSQSYRTTAYNLLKRLTSHSRIPRQSCSSMNDCIYVSIYRQLPAMNGP